MKQTIVKGPPKRLLALLLAVFLVAMLLPAAALAEDSHITVTQPDPVEGITGSLYKVPLSEIFEDGEGHSLSYSYLCEQDLTQHTKIDEGIFCFSVDRAGEYDVTLQASCEDDTVVCTLHCSIEPAPDGLPVQYNYDQSNQHSVQVFVTISSDGIPIVGKDENATILSHVPITVPYFDLSNYELQDYYRYRTDSDGSYNGSTVIERPTALHLYIYLLERFALGYPEEECGTGIHNPLSDSFDSGTMIENMFGGEAYEAACLPLNITGSSTSMYMQQFWGHDENLMYYRNHAYPLMRAGWGSTADYILLSDGDTIDLAMFTDWGFYTHGAFMCFGGQEEGQNGYTPCNSYHLPSAQDAGEEGVSLTTTLLKFGTQSVSDGGVDLFLPEEVADNQILIFKEVNGVLDVENFESCSTEEDGSFTATFTEDGVYQLVFLDPGAGSDEACQAPATALVNVGARVISYEAGSDGKHTRIETIDCDTCGQHSNTRTEEDCADADGNGSCDACGAKLVTILYGDADGDGSVTSKDAALVRQAVAQKAVIIDSVSADVDGDGVLTSKDATCILRYVAEKITTFPVENKTN